MNLKKFLMTTGLLLGFFLLPTLTFASGGPLPEVWSVAPFVLLLLMIATGPLFFEHFWHKYYPTVSIALGVIVVLYYLFFLGNTEQPIHSLAEYFSFISLLTALFVASGGILIKVDKKGTPMVNIAMLVIGALIANVIGTTGASMLLIRPFIRLNKDRIKPYQIVFFIFMVSNVGGCLTPIGDPPLFLGFLKGIPFEWTVVNIWTAWIFGIGLLSIMFYFIDSRNTSGEGKEDREYTGTIKIKGLKNLVWLGIIIAAVFIDPAVVNGVPYIPIGDEPNVFKFSYVREVIMLACAIGSFKFADKDCLRGNEFDFEPIREVAYLFVGIFATMMPALQLVAYFASHNSELITTDSLYWATGALSGVLDNAPTYMNFLTAAIAKIPNFDIGNPDQVRDFAAGTTDPGSVIDLFAISVSAVFFGAMTYIGNAPNFMVKNIAEQVGIEMPSFVGYVIRYSVPFLLPVLFLTWLVFFVLM